MLIRNLNISTNSQWKWPSLDPGEALERERPSPEHRALASARLCHIIVIRAKIKIQKHRPHFVKSSSERRESLRRRVCSNLKVHIGIIDTGPLGAAKKCVLSSKNNQRLRKIKIMKLLPWFCSSLDWGIWDFPKWTALQWEWIPGSY